MDKKRRIGLMGLIAKGGNAHKLNGLRGQMLSDVGYRLPLAQ